MAYDDQHASLPALLAALDRGESFVTLDDGTIGLLPEEWLRKHAPIARLGSRDGTHIRFKASQAALLDSLIAAQPEASWDETFARARAELKTFDGIRPVDPPATFAGTLRGYQCEGLGWLLFLQRFGFGGCLADDMGLGKTVMVLALLATRRDAQTDADRRPSLVVAPRSVVFNWRQEAARFTPELRVLRIHRRGPRATRAQFGDHDLVLTTYGTLRRDAAHLAATAFDYVVLDEAQAIKNAASVSAKTTRLLNARHRLALSGTPVENHLGELWSLFEFLNPGLLSTAPAFERAGAGRRMDEGAVAMLARGLRPVHPAADEGAGREGAAGQDRTDPVLRSRAAAAHAVRRAAEPLPPRLARRPARTDSAPRLDGLGQAARSCRSSKRCCGCARPRAIRG